MGALRKSVGLIETKGCSKLFLGLQSSPALMSQSNGPFSGLVICVTGLSKEARKQVMEATGRLGGQYSPHLHPQCTHLVVQIAVADASLSMLLNMEQEMVSSWLPLHGLWIVSGGIAKVFLVLIPLIVVWLHGLSYPGSVLFPFVLVSQFLTHHRVPLWKSVVDVRMSESLYDAKSVGQNGQHTNELHRLLSPEQTCLPDTIHQAEQFEMSENYHRVPIGTETRKNKDLTLAWRSMYLDSGISDELRNKVLKVADGQGVKLADKWFVGCNVSHVVCEGASIQRYLGHAATVVSPLWLLKTVKEKRMQRLVHISPDLARHLGLMFENLQNGSTQEKICVGDNLQGASRFRIKSTKERKEIVDIAKCGVRKRRNPHLQTRQNPIRPITPTSLLENISWTVSEPTSTAAIFSDSCSNSDDFVGHPQTLLFEGKGDGLDSEASFTNSTRPLSEIEKTDLIFKNHFLTILFPIDRFSEMGPCSRTYFSNNGFTCLQILDYIYEFYQENMADHEIEVAIHTDSRHADRLRTAYCSKETEECGELAFKRIELLGSRKSFEMLKRVTGDNNSNVYELLIRA